MGANSSTPLLYRLCRWTLQAALGFYFTRIERFHPERVPLEGPVLFASNHPNSLTDAFVVGSSVPRKVNFVATVQLFRIQPVRWLLDRCGVIAINRVQDDPRAMRDVQKTFEACFRVLEKGEAVGIFPEGKCSDELQLGTVKTGAARIALELEGRHSGKLGLKIVPVGLTFSSKATYRSAALVNFGQPICVADFLDGYATKRHACIHALTSEIESRLQSLIVHLPHLERTRIVEAAKRLYLDRLQVGNTVVHEPVTPISEELLLTQAISRAVDFAFEKHPQQAAEFVRRLGHYEAALHRLHLSDEVLQHFPGQRWLLRQSLVWAAVAILGAPVALYGWLHRLVPYALVRSVVRQVAKQRPDKTQISTATILSGLVAFTGFYAVCVVVFYQFFGLKATVLYACSLPPASLIAHYYGRELRRFAASLRTAIVLLKAPWAARKLLNWRAELIELIDAERQEFRVAQAPAKSA